MSGAQKTPESGTRRQRFRRRLGELPVFPTLLTAGNLACGVTAIFCAASSQGFLVQGAILIFAAMFCDMLDGKVARMTGTEGDFGTELDSLADVVSFGVAPAMLVHRLVLGDHPQKVWGEGEGWMSFIVIVYAVLTAIRLARYNVEHSSPSESTKAFKGLPSPGAAAFLCSWVLFHAWYFPSAEELALGAAATGDLTLIMRLIGPEWWQAGFRFFLMGSTVVMALLMVSSFRFPHFGNVLLGGRISFSKLVLLLVILGLVVMRPLYAMIICTTVYILIGLVPGSFAVLRAWRSGREVSDDVFGDDEDEDDDDRT